jgi:hypothetical protein
MRAVLFPTSRAEAEALARKYGCVIGEDGPDEQFEVSFTLGRLEALIRQVRHEDWIASFPTQEGNGE